MVAATDHDWSWSVGDAAAATWGWSLAEVGGSELGPDARCPGGKFRDRAEGGWDVSDSSEFKLYRRGQDPNTSDKISTTA